MNQHSIAGKKFIEEHVRPIPEEFSLCAENNLYTHLGHRREIYYYRGIDRFPFDSSPEVIAHLDVSTDNGRTILLEKEIKGIDFERANVYQSFSLNFSQEKERKLEFRVLFTGRADLWVDSISIQGANLSLEREYEAL